MQSKLFENQNNESGPAIREEEKKKKWLQCYWADEARVRRGEARRGNRAGQMKGDDGCVDVSCTVDSTQYRRQLRETGLAVIAAAFLYFWSVFLCISLLDSLTMGPGD